MSASNIASVAAAEPEMRLGARVLVLDPHDRVLLIHARDPDEPSSQWWELPGGGIDPGETPQAAASRELAEETGFLADELGPACGPGRRAFATGAGSTIATRPFTSRAFATWPQH